MESVLQTSLASLLFATSSLLPLVSLQTPQTNVPEASQERLYRVKAGESLSQVAEEAYGDFLYWTTIWNDNAYIQNPNVVEPGMTLQIRSIKPIEIEGLKPELAQKIEVKEQVAQASVSPTTQPTQSPTPSKKKENGNSLTDAQITFLGNCEAGMNPARNSGNGYYGAFQFSYGTWKSMNTGYERADLAPLDVQIDAVQRLVKRSSIFTQFPACARRMQRDGII